MNGTWVIEMRILSTLLIALALAGCTATHNVDRTTLEGVRLDSTGSAYVSTPENGRYGQTVYHQSGHQTAAAVSRAFSPHLRRTTQGSLATDRYSALKAASAGNYDYLIQPEILHWEDRATEWSGLLDKIRLRITVLDVASGQVLDSAELSAQSKWATLGGDHPEHLLDEPLTEYARSLFP